MAFFSCLSSSVPFVILNAAKRMLSVLWLLYIKYNLNWLALENRCIYLIMIELICFVNVVKLMFLNIRCIAIEVEWSLRSKWITNLMDLTRQILIIRYNKLVEHYHIFIILVFSSRLNVYLILLFSLFVNCSKLGVSSSIKFIRSNDVFENCWGGGGGLEKNIASHHSHRQWHIKRSPMERMIR